MSLIEPYRLRGEPEREIDDLAHCDEARLMLECIRGDGIRVERVPARLAGLYHYYASADLRWTEVVCGDDGRWRWRLTAAGVEALDRATARAIAAASLLRAVSDRGKP
jgi:hypothetical protein